MQHSLPDRACGGVVASVLEPHSPHALDTPGSEGSAGNKTQDQTQRPASFSNLFQNKPPRPLLQQLKEAPFDQCLALVKSNHSLATPNTFHGMMSRFGRSGNPLCVVRAFKCMKELGCRPSAKTYSLLIRPYTERGDVVSARKYLEEMKSDGLRPDGFLYGLLAQAYMKVSRFQDGLALLEEMETQGIQPHLSVYAALLSGFAAADQMETAYHLLSLAKRTGLPLTHDFYQPLVEAHMNRGESDKLLELIQEMNRLGIDLFRTPSLRATSPRRKPSSLPE